MSQDYLVLEKLNFYEPITIFNDDLLVLDFKQNKVLVLNKDGMVINTYQFEVEENGQRTSTGSRQDSRVMG